MSTSADNRPPKHSHALRQLVGTVVIAGATYAAEKIIESRRRKKMAKKK